ncbi:50S ribosomal protein L2 [Frigoriglobus tundricola]|uniref:Large ribosomal subunit protein uL2 n=1 Tax=Frigoriglobus tundricola TaxID=2774151 RepID=A0A6M5YVI7_9BACT|nr:50S ribosomal protein L2 [Frigoriglobus tundricola]QJW97520.1 LSU ribosomal protein L2p (L8e) [Frigoriglobus tundricola]
MGIKQYKPTSAGRRAGMVSDFADCTHPRENKPEKSLLKPKPKKGGRNNQGITCTRFRGGGHKQRYRQIDFKRVRDNVAATVIQVEYDPNRTSRIALIEYPRDDKHEFSRAYIIAPNGLKAGDKVISGESDAVEPKPGNCMPLWKVPLGMTVHNVELVPGKGGQICRSAGCGATLTAREKEWAQLTMPSGEIRRVSSKCRATIGTVSHAEHMNISIGKAGRMRWKGRKPHNRGTSMNPTDHPLGGGEGRSKGGRNPVSPTGVPAKGGKTRHKRKPGGKAIIRRRPAGPFQNTA